MAEREKPNRDTQIELMMGAEERLTGHLRAWISKPEVKQALHRNDRCDDDNHHDMRRVAAR
jgi:hypothetical protein